MAIVITSSDGSFHVRDDFNGPADVGRVGIDGREPNVQTGMNGVTWESGGSNTGSDYISGSGTLAVMSSGY